MSTLDEAIEYIRMGNREEGRQILEEILESDEGNEEVWLWLSSVVDSDEDREICLENVLALDPDNIVAQKGLEALQSGTFNVGDLLSDVLEEEDEEEESTFIDDFIVGDDDDDELEMPSTMRSSKGKSGGRFNPRLLILGVLIVLVIVVLGGIAAFALLSNGGGDVPAIEDTPVDTPIPEATATETSTPEPTDTPTITLTPTSILPTADTRPTNTPTLLPTQVVSPTPNN